ncbi:MAG: PepSY domain-containing protein [Gammaproteobacteria bacterium]
MKIESKLLQVGVVVGLLALYPTAFAYPGQQQYAKQAQISLSQARKIATKAFPGKIISQELEKEKGGSGLRYSFDIKQGKIVHEVGVDAKTGKVLENDSEEGGD